MGDSDRGEGVTAFALRSASASETARFIAAHRLGGRDVGAYRPVPDGPGGECDGLDVVASLERPCVDAVEVQYGNGFGVELSAGDRVGFSDAGL